MKPPSSCWILFLAFVATVAESSSVSETTLDTSREAVALDVTTMRPEGTYLDTLSVHSVADMELSGWQMQTNEDRVFVLEMTVTDLLDGSHQVDLTLDGAKITLETMGLTVLNCDSHNKETSKSALCQPFHNLVGKSSRLVVDDHGEVAEEPRQEEPAQAVNAPFASPSDHLMSTTRLLNLMPAHPVAPGESWDATQSGIADDFIGTATLLGYKDFQGHDVAVIQIEGTKRVNLESTKMKYAAMVPIMGSDLSLDDIAVRATMYFDNEAKFTRYTKSDLSFTMHMTNPIDGSGLTIPIQETVTSTSQLRGE